MKCVFHAIPIPLATFFRIGTVPGHALWIDEFSPVGGNGKETPCEANGPT